jgi:hypothetical protein
MKRYFKTHRNKSTLALIAASLIAGSAVAVGLINPGTVRENIQYRDASFLQRGEATEAVVQAVEKPDLVFAGSGTEPGKNFELRINLTRKVGSVTEQERFVGEFEAGEGPAQVDVYRADDEFKPAGSSSEGVFEITRFDKQVLSGRLLGDNLDAKSESIGR